MQLKSILSKIQFWILFFFLLRLVGITNPPLEKNHNWRQASGLMIARNFLQVDNSILYPRKDDHKGLEGIVAIEFPLHNYLHYLVSEIFGYAHWYGRLINLIISSIGMWYFFLLIKTLFHDRLAFYSTIILIVSIWFSFSRKMMPDTFSISLVFMGLYHGIKYLEGYKNKHLLFYFIFATLGILAKIPAAVFLMSLAIPFFSKPVINVTKIKFVIVSFFVVAIVYWWYFVWYLHLSRTFGIWHNEGTPLLEGLKALLTHYPDTLEKFYFSAFQGFILFGCFLVGLFFAIKHQYKKLLLFGALVFSLFVLFTLKTGNIFYCHNYYIIPFVPVMAVFAAYALTQLKKQKWLVALVFFGCVESMANQLYDFRIPASEKYKLSLEEIMDKTVPKDALIAINHRDENHQIMYFANRKGWLIYNEEATDSAVLNHIYSEGGKYLVIDKHEPVAEQNAYATLFENDDFKVMRLEKISE